MLLILKEPWSYRIKSFLSLPIKKKKRKEPFLGWLHGLVTSAGAEGFSLRKAPCLVLLLPSWNSQKFYLWTCKLSWKESEAHVWTEVRCPTCTHPLSLQYHSIHIVFTVPGEHRIPVDSWCMGVQWDLKQAQGKCITFMTNWEGGWQPPRTRISLECQKMTMAF